MEVAICQRINLVLKENSVSVNALAKQLKLSQTTLSMQLRGERALSAHIVELILEAFPDVSAEWLMRGKGRMHTVKSLFFHDEEPLMASGPSPLERMTSVPDSVWKARYETMKECYDSLLSSLGGVMGKRNVG